MIVVVAVMVVAAMVMVVLVGTVVVMVVVVSLWSFLVIELIFFVPIAIIVKNCSWDYIFL